MKEKQIFSNNILIITVLPITEILEVEIIHRENAHGYAALTAYIQGNDINHCIGEKVAFYKLEEHNQELLFQGMIETILTSKCGSYVKAEIIVYTKTKQLEGNIHNKSFQRVQLTYEDVAEQIVQEWGGNVIWGDEKKRQIMTPIIQYRENDWQFLIRLASHFHTALYPILTAEQVVSIGWRKGKEQQGGRILQEGISELFYAVRAISGIYDKKKFSFLFVEHDKEWQIGDYLMYNNLVYTVYRREIKYKKGELTYFYELGTEGTIYHKKKYADKLKGARIKGTICKAIQESVTLQLDIDTKEENEYEWPWTPEIGNGCYFMPERGTEAILYFPTAREMDGIVLHQLRKNGSQSRNVGDKEVITAEKKMLKLYPKEIILETLGESFMLTDNYGIKLNSTKKINMEAVGNIHITGENITVTAPNRVICQTSISNIEMCKSFNFYAPGGVQKTEKIKDAICQRVEQKVKENGGCYQIAFAALAAIPTGNCGMDIMELEVGLMASSAIPKIGNGATVFSMMETMQGKKKDEVSFPDALGCIDNYTSNGSYAIPEE